jgi:hypothetical protein
LKIDCLGLVNPILTCPEYEFPPALQLKFRYESKLCQIKRGIDPKAVLANWSGPGEQHHGGDAAVAEVR